jgi:AraC-like DNA-binding protein
MPATSSLRTPVKCTTAGRSASSPVVGASSIFDVDAMASVTAHHGQHLEIARPVIRDRALMQALDRLFSRLERWNANRATGGGPAEALAFEERLVESCVHLMAHHGAASVTTAVPPEDLRLVRERLADEISEAPSLADLAAMTGLSRYQVLRRFEKAFGLPPHAWLRQRRAERARQLIREGGTLATAAVECGFVDQSHMTRDFVRQFGFTPGAWRKALICNNVQDAPCRPAYSGPDGGRKE